MSGWTPGVWLVIYGTGKVRSYPTERAARFIAKMAQDVSEGNVGARAVPLAQALAAPDGFAFIAEIADEACWCDEPDEEIGEVGTIQCRPCRARDLMVQAGATAR